MANKRIWIKLSVDGILDNIAYKEANGFDFEARALKGIFKMTVSEKQIYEKLLLGYKASKARREAGYPGN